MYHCFNGTVNVCFKTANPLFEDEMFKKQEKEFMIKGREELIQRIFIKRFRRASFCFGGPVIGR